MHQVNQRYRRRDRRRCALTGSAHQYCHEARQARQASRCHPPQLSASFRIPCFRSSIGLQFLDFAGDGSAVGPRAARAECADPMVVRGSTVIAVVLMGACSASRSSPSSRDPIASLAFTSAFAPPVLPSSVQGGTLPLHPERLTPALVSVRGAAVQLLAARRGRASGGGGRGGGRAKRDESEDEEITTFVSCPNCLADTCARPPLRLLLELYRACCRHRSF